MERRPIRIRSKAQRRLRRWAREIVLAAALTAVAAAFIVTALLRSETPAPEAAFETARTPGK
jgi:hypothetical protein